MLECGLALIAACLPTLSFLLSHHNIKSAIRSVRGALSLPSLTSSDRTSKEATYGLSEQTRRVPYADLESVDSSTSNAQIFRGPGDRSGPKTLRDTMETREATEFRL